MPQGHQALGYENQVASVRSWAFILVGPSENTKHASRRIVRPMTEIQGLALQYLEGITLSKAVNYHRGGFVGWGKGDLGPLGAISLKNKATRPLCAYYRKEGRGRTHHSPQRGGGGGSTPRACRGLITFSHVQRQYDTVVFHY